MRLISLAVAVVALVLGRATAPVAQPTFAKAAAGGQTVPAPKDVLGFTPGDDYKLADFPQLQQYFQALDNASDRVKVYSAGKSTEGNDMIVALISSEANLARADHYRDISKKLAYVRGVSPDAARALAREGKAVVWIDNGLHASEVATAQHAFVLAHRMASDDSAEIREIRDNVILVLLPTVNPDGMNLVVDWYRKNLKTPSQDSPMPWLYQKYIGHDNNRDAYMQTQAETRVVNTLLYREWLPQIMYNQHQAGWPPPRMFVPPFPDPFNPNIDPQVIRGIDLVGGAMLDRFERERKPGVVSRYQFSTWFNGSIRTAAYFHNMIGILTETWHPSATPFTYDSKRFPREFDNGVPVTTPSSNYPNPWMGGTVRLADAVDYMLTGSLAVLQVAAKYREQFLLGIYQIGARQVEKGAAEAPVAYIISPEQHDPPAAALFVETLMRGAVEVHRADGPFSADGTLYPAGTWVVRMDQPFRPFARDLLEPQRYPDQRSSPGGPPLPPYDSAGWTLAYQMGVGAVAVTSPLAATLTQLTEYPRIPGRVVLPPRALPHPAARPTMSSAVADAGLQAVGAGTYAIEPRANAAFRVVNRLLAAGVRVARVPTGGSFLVTIKDPRQGRQLADLVGADGVQAQRVDRLPRIATPPLAVARIGLYKSWVANIDEGWTRWLLEQYAFPYTTLTDADVRGGALRDRFDVIILPDQAPRRIVSGHQPTDRPREGPWGPVPLAYQGGIGEAGVGALKAFVQSGGRLITFDAASDLPLESFGGVFAHIRNTVSPLSRTTFYCPGSVLRLDVDIANPVASGMSARPAAYFANSRGFETDDPTVVSIARYAARADDVLMSGWLLGAERLAGRHAVLQVPLGQGSVLLFAFRPQFRAQPHATFKLWFNGLYR
jgi:Zinc carboxypeptidase